MDRTPKSHTGRTVALVVGIGVVAFVVIGIWQSLNDYATPPPSFPSLRDQPDPSLHGTVAYYDMGTQCIEAVSASGATARQLYCPQERNLGGGIVLEWQAGGQLAMTLYEWPAGGFLPVWRKSVDASTLEVTDLGLNGVPTSPPELTEPGLGPDGTRMEWSAGGGTITVIVDDGTASRVVFEGTGSPDYGGDGFPPLWSPDGQWILLDDGRLLVITVAEPSTTRLLAEQPSSWTSARILGVAVTGEDVLGSG